VDEYLHPIAPRTLDTLLAEFDRRIRRLEHRGPERWHDIGDIGEPAFQNSWAPEAGAPVVPRYRMTLGAGLEIQGAFTGGAYGTVAFTLPVGYRPLDGTLYLAGSDINSNPITLQVETTGDVTILAGSIPDGSVTTVKLADGAVTTVKLADSGVTAGAYGDASHVAAVTVDAKGRITAAASTAIAIAEAAVTGLVADLAAKLGLSVFTTKGDIVVATGAGTVARLGVGANTQVLTADSTQATGLKGAAAAGGGGSSPLTTKGDVWGFSSADARIPVGTNGQVLTADSAQTLGLKWGSAPAAQEFDYVEKTAPMNITSTSTTTPDTFITGSSVTYDGSTRVVIEFFAPSIIGPTSSAGFVIVTLWDGATGLGRLLVVRSETVTGAWTVCYAKRFLTPSAGSHQYFVKARVTTGTGQITAGVGGTDTELAAFLRITRA
jgi:hypothetical protein